MDFHRIHLKVWVAVVLAAGILAYSAQAQSSDDSLLSKPADDSTPDSSDSLQLPEDGTAVKGLGSGSNLPLPPPRNPNAAWQKTLNDRKNWTLMTPEEIMGVQTPEQIFGLPEKGIDKNSAAEDRYLQREINATDAMATNGGAADNGNNYNNGDKRTSHKEFGLFDQPDVNDPFSAQYKKVDDGSSGFSHIFDTGQNQVFGQKSHATQLGPVATAAAAKARAQEDAEMARFRAMIGESSQAGSPSSAPVTPFASPSLQPISQFDVFGHPLASQASDLSKPTGLTPLTEFTGHYTPPKKTQKPAWEAQTPPWLSQGLPAPGTIPQRKFY